MIGETIDKWVHALAVMKYNMKKENEKEESQNKKQLKNLKEIITTEDFLIKAVLKETKDLKTYVKHLARRHTLKEIYVADQKGNLLISTNHDGKGIAKSVYDTMKYMKDKDLSANSQYLMVKDNDWKLVYPDGDKVYIMESPVEVSPIELKIIVRDVKKALDKFKGE